MSLTTMRGLPGELSMWVEGIGWAVACVEANAKAANALTPQGLKILLDSR